MSEATRAASSSCGRPEIEIGGSSAMNAWPGAAYTVEPARVATLPGCGPHPVDARPFRGLRARSRQVNRVATGQRFAGTTVA